METNQRKAAERQAKKMEGQAPVFNKRESHSVILVVLNDGETYSSLQGCRLVFMKDEDFDDEDVKTAYEKGRELIDILVQ